MGIQISSRRDQLTIMMDLLEMFKQPRRLTKVFYKSKMSYNQLTKYFNELIKLKFIDECNEVIQEFIISEKGREFLELLQIKEPVTLEVIKT
jgi:predicted transcriptional regulator